MIFRGDESPSFHSISATMQLNDISSHAHIQVMLRYFKDVASVSQLQIYDACPLPLEPRSQYETAFCCGLNLFNLFMRWSIYFQIGTSCTNMIFSLSALFIITPGLDYITAAFFFRSTS
jgi:hypothetical protein